MKKIALTVISIALCLLFVGCMAKDIPDILPRPTARPNSSDGSRRETEGPTIPPLSEDVLNTFAPVPITGFDFEPLYYDVIRTSGGATSGSRYKVFHDYESFKAEFGDISAATGDHYTEESFENMFVVAVWTTVNTGGWKVDLNSAVMARGKVDVDIKLEPPAPNELVTQAFETHCVLVAFSSKDADRSALEFGVTINGGELNGFGDDI